jgi:hypothetical protein
MISANQLREINPELWVPPTPAKVVLAVVFLCITAWAIFRLWSKFRRLFFNKKRDPDRFLNKLQSVNRLRLQQYISYAETVERSVDILRRGLRSADRRSGGSGGHRTTGEWMRWSEEVQLGSSLQTSLRRIFEIADQMKFGNDEIGLDQVRFVTSQSQNVLQQLADDYEKRTWRLPTGRAT